MPILAVISLIAGNYQASHPYYWLICFFETEERSSPSIGSYQGKRHDCSAVLEPVSSLLKYLSAVVIGVIRVLTTI